MRDTILESEPALLDGGILFGHLPVESYEAYSARTIAKLRRRLNLSEEDFGLLLNFDDPADAVRRLESGKSTPSAHSAQLITMVEFAVCAIDAMEQGNIPQARSLLLAALANRGG